MSYASIGIFNLPTEGQLPTALPSFLDPPTVEDGPITRVAPGSLASVKWSINSTTTSDTSKGATVQAVGDAYETYVMEIAPAQPGDFWIDTTLADGFAVLFQPKAPTDLQPTLTFIATKDAAVISSMAGPQGQALYVDGPDELLQQAKTAPSTPAEPPPGTSTPVPVPSTNTGYAPPCKPGDMEVFGLCYPILGLPTTETPPVPGTTTPIPTPTPVPTTETPPTKTAGLGGAPSWLLPALAVTAIVSVAVIASGKKGKRRP